MRLRERWRSLKDSMLQSVPDMLDNVNVWGVRWPRESTKFRRVLFEPFGSYCRLVGWHIIQLEFFSFIEMHIELEWMQVVRKDVNVSLICHGRTRRINGSIPGHLRMPHTLTQPPLV
ncbi:hypothetical protein TNCT_466601 [Trichonephila clavata]|uniref:Uncharacterized protein n=1 Tax=Trichonephila clavata TaxID=2740835 RepID=A0A8X6KF10_TRICU|nr:hypothetical protein TNCT_466601 [Trichonephila clavata]